MPTLGITELLLIGLIGLVYLVVDIFYLMTLQKCLNRVSEENRGMSPGLVWLNLIPLFGLGWHFYTVIKINSREWILFREDKTNTSNGIFELVIDP